ncbi:MAG: DUF2520 domain-containing protein [Betaproteobacteria bacterium]|nr:DUF2520 domain-containing protein [Betaproteobacteria bacterium]MBI2292109.1 DUF2520 domain-containing protein [Betaproteobacteria bacterium]MBI3056869.1 DUF2520 domain-containing protein [Betaproteobacteria bacterium]
MATTTLNIIGCGRVGRALARLWAQDGAFTIQDVLDRRLEQSRAAVAFIGQGTAVDAVGQMRAAGAWMLTPPDDQIVACCAALAASGLLAAGNIVFHCSGALPSRDLAPAAARGAVVASVHPLKSFADPASAAQTFGGTYCAAEGDAAALAVLRPAFERIGGSVSEIDPGFKTVYHAASVIVCNYLTALLETGLRCYEKSGFERETALRMMEPLVRETLDNAFRLGTVQALTGPIARGDHAVVAHHLEALGAWEPRIATIYRQLGAVAVELARAQGKADADALAAIERMLAGK